MAITFLQSESSVGLRFGTSVQGNLLRNQCYQNFNFYLGKQHFSVVGYKCKTIKFKKEHLGKIKIKLVTFDTFHLFLGLTDLGFQLVSVLGDKLKLNYILLAQLLNYSQLCLLIILLNYFL